MGLGTLFQGGYETTPGTSGWGPVADGGTYGRNLSRQKWDNIGSNFGNNFTSAFNALNKANGWKNQSQQGGYSGPFSQPAGGGSEGTFTKVGSGATLFQPGSPEMTILHSGMGAQQGGGGGGGNKIANAAFGAGIGFLKGGPVGALAGGLGGLLG